MLDCISYLYNSTSMHFYVKPKYLTLAIGILQSDCGITSKEIKESNSNSVLKTIHEWKMIVGN